MNKVVNVKNASPHNIILGLQKALHDGLPSHATLVSVRKASNPILGTDGNTVYFEDDSIILNFEWSEEE